MSKGNIYYEVLTQEIFVEDELTGNSLPFEVICLDGGWRLRGEHRTFSAEDLILIANILEELNGGE